VALHLYIFIFWESRLSALSLNFPLFCAKQGKLKILTSKSPQNIELKCYHFASRFVLWTQFLILFTIFDEQSFIQTATASDISLVYVSISPASSSIQDLDNWRFFTSQDGMTESWIGSVTAGADGRMWINHGDVDSMSSYDGYRFSRLPSPIPNAKVFCDPSGDLWTISAGNPSGFQRFHDGRWETKTVNLEDFQTMSSHLTNMNRLPFLPASLGKIYYLLPDSLMIFDYDSGTSTQLLRTNETHISRFTDMIRAHDGSLWITGSNGIVHCSPSMKTPPSPSKWKAFPLPETIRAANPKNLIESDDHEVFMIADSRMNGKKVLLIFNGTSWHMMDFNVEGILYSGWRGLDRSIWLRVAESDVWNAGWNLYHLADNNVEIIKKNRVLSGFFADMVTTDGGCFWIATSSGLARYSPPAWRTPAGIHDIQRNVGYALETNDGTIFFATENSLLTLHEDVWKTIPIPETFHPWIKAFCMIDGRKLVLGSRKSEIVFYDTARKSFGLIRHPSATEIYVIQQHSDDSAWIYSQTTAGDYQLEILKNDRFEPLPFKIEASDSGATLWNIQTAANGDIWFMGATGLTRYHDKHFQKFEKKDGYSVGGAFCFLQRGDGKIWIGGRDMIQEFDGNTWTTVKSTDLETVRSLTQCSDGSIIAGSGTGIHRYFQNSWITQNFKDGLPEAVVFKVFEDKAHRIWSCSTAGISLYHPESDVYPPETYITPQDTILHWAPGGNGNIGFYGVDKWEYTSRDRLLFSWRIDEGPWSPFQQAASAVFSGLEAGTHHLKVRSIDRTLNVDNSPAACTIVVLTPWYRETGFLVIISLGGMVILSLFGFAVTRHVQLERLVVKRTAHLQSEISERKSAEKALRESETRYRTLVENIPQRIFMKDRNFRYVSINENLARDLGIRPEEVVGKVDSDIVSKEYAAKYREDEIRIIETGKTEEFEEKHFQNGVEVWINTIKTPVRDNNGKIIGILGIFWDITDRKRTEEELKKHREHLEELVKERTSQLEASNAELEAFSYSVSHDLRNPLRLIDGFSGMLMEKFHGILGDEGNRLLVAVRSNTTRMAQLIDDLLIFSHMGRKEMTRVRINMENLARSVFDDLKQTTGDRVIEVIIGPLPPAFGDLAMFRQVFVNLLSNALKFTRYNDRAVIQIEGRVEGSENIYSVRDNGVGFDMEYKNKLFGVFQRLHSQEKFEGTGIGLSIVQRIIHRHGGRVWAEGVVNGGACFWFALPVKGTK
jgi:PAS domain S-box-containing protein